MRWLVTGAGGMLGRDVVGLLEACGDRGDHVAGADRAQLDVTDSGGLAAAFAEHRPDVVVNCAAYTAVEAAETHRHESFQANAVGPARLAAACAAHGARLVHVSTDAVFSGRARSAYPEWHPPAPRTVYGRSKLAGERAVLARLPGSAAIARTGWLYGAGGRSFVRAMIESAEQGENPRVVADQYGQPTWSADVAARLVTLGRRADMTGVFHVTNSGRATWFELAQEVFSLLGADRARVSPISTAEFGGQVSRPRFTVLGHGRWGEFGLAPLRHWREALKEGIGPVRCAVASGRDGRTGFG